MSKKMVILAMMKASIVGPAGSIGCTVGTQKTCPIVPRHALGTYITFFCSPYSPSRSYNWSLHHCKNRTFFLRHPVQTGIIHQTTCRCTRWRASQNKIKNDEESSQGFASSSPYLSNLSHRVWPVPHLTSATWATSAPQYSTATPQ